MGVINYLLIEEDVDEEALLVSYLSREDTDDIFKKGEEEGAFEILITRHLVDNETKFRVYFNLLRLILICFIAYSKRHNKHKV